MVQVSESIIVWTVHAHWPAPSHRPDFSNIKIVLASLEACSIAYLEVVPNERANHVKWKDMKIYFWRDYVSLRADLTAFGSTLTEPDF